MKDLLSKVSIQVNEKIYLKDPESTDLGKRIVKGSIDLIHELGFDRFTFRKLAERIGTTEASVYRYFESKHKTLLYLTSWYWAWMEYRLVFTLANIESANERLERAIKLLTEEVSSDKIYAHIDEQKLNEIVISESSKAYLTREVDRENREGAFSGYKHLVARIGQIIKEINPNFKYPHMLVSTVIEGAHHERYFANHLPGLTDVVKGEDAIVEFYHKMVFNTILTKKK